MFQLSGPVLVAVSLDNSSQEPLHVARDLAKAHDVPLHVCHALAERHVIRQMLPHTAAESVLPLTETEASARFALNDFIASAIERNDVPVTLEEGSVPSTLLRVAERISAGLIVMSTSSSNDGRASLSAITERVVRHAHCPVLVVRPAPKGLVLAATDFSDSSFLAIEAGASEAKRRWRSLAIVHAIDLLPITAIPEPGIRDVVPNEEIAREIRRTSKEQLEASVVQFDAHGGGFLEVGPAARAILKTAEVLSAELLVIGTRGRTGLRRLLLGSVAEHVLREARCSVLVVRHPRKE